MRMQLKDTFFCFPCLLLGGDLAWKKWSKGFEPFRQKNREA